MYIFVGCLFMLFAFKSIFFDTSILLGLIFGTIGVLVLIFKPKQSSKSDAFADSGDGDGGD